MADGSRRERRLVYGTTVLLVVLIGVAGIVSLNASGGTAGWARAWADTFLDVAAALPGAVAMFLGYVAVVVGREVTNGSAEQARRSRLDATAPAVAIRLGEVSSVGTGDEVCIDLELSLQNYGSVPAVATPGRPSLGFVRERGAVALAPSSVQVLRMSVRVPEESVRAQRENTRESRFGWRVIVPVVVTNMAGTVTDDVHLDFRLRPFARTSDLTWAQVADVVVDNSVYGRVIRRCYRDPAADSPLDDEGAPTSPAPSPRVAAASLAADPYA